MVWNIQVCNNPMPRSRDISNEAREAVAAADKSGKVYMTVSLFSVHNCAVRKFIQKWKTFKTVASFPAVDIPASSPKGQTIFRDTA